MLSEARKQANKKWNEKNVLERYERLTINLPKGRAIEIKDQAKQRGYTSTSKYLIDLIEKDKK